MASDVVLDSLNCAILAEAKGGRVVIDKDVQPQFDELEDKAKAQFLRVMDLWNQNQRLTSEQFNGNEGRAKRGSLNVMLSAFKRFKIRLYGFAGAIGGLRTFVVVAVDPAKKQDRADPKVLKRARERALDLYEKAQG
jgi:hypothetical protein